MHLRRAERSTADRSGHQVVWRRRAGRREDSQGCGEGGRGGALGDPVVDLAPRDGAERAIALARSGAKIVICAHATARREERLKGLAPTSFVLRAATVDGLGRALQAALG